MNEFSPAAVIAMVQRQIAEFGRSGATGIERVADLSAAIAVAPGAGLFTEVPAPLLTFQEPGYVIAMYGQERTGTPAKFALTELRLQINGSRDLVRSGTAGGAFFPFLGLFGPLLNWFPLTRRVEKNNNWQFSFRNFDTAATAFPTVGLAFLSDEQIDIMAAELSRR